MGKIELNQFLNFKYISGLTSNPNKTLMAFAVAKAKLEKNTYDYDLYYSDGKKHTKVMSMHDKSSFIWESDDSILFQLAKSKLEKKAVKNKSSIYYRYKISTKQTEKAYEFSFPASIDKILKENQMLLSAKLTKKQRHLYLDSAEARKLFLEEEKKKDLYVDISEIPFYFNGGGFTANVRDQLFIYQIDNKKITPLVDNDFSAEQVKVSDDLTQIYYTGSQSKGIKPLTSQIYCYDIKQKQTNNLYNKDDFSISNIYLFDNQIVVTATNMKDYGINQNDLFYVLKNNALQLLATPKHNIGNSLGTDVRLGASQKTITKDKSLLFLSTVDDHIELYSLDSKGLIQPQYIFDGAIEGLCEINQKLYIIGLYRQKLQEIYALDLEMHEQKQVSRFNQGALKGLYVAKPKTFVAKFPSHQVKGFVLYPEGYEATKIYPAILDIHGGPKTVYGKVYYHEMQYWANQGYIVFFSNPRGSDGKGNEFADLRGKYGTIDYEDLMAFTDLIVKRHPSIDQDKMFVTGGSYGGYMTNWIVGQTNRFKAAATQRSISNWLAFHGTSDIGFYFSQDQTDGHPNTDTTKLWDQSPMKHALNVNTPLLFIHSDLDYRCPIEQAMEFYTILKQKGLETKFIWFKGETHELSRSGKPQARIKRLDEITKWFKQY